jgi:hypothetical protein
MEYLASCHCGALSARYHTELPPAQWSVRACQCSFCQAHAAHSISDPAGLLEFRSRVPHEVQRYRFGSRATQFLICSCCGVYVGARVELPAHARGILNARTLRPVPEGLPAALAMDYSRESTTERQARRAARWTPLSADSV